MSKRQPVTCSNECRWVVKLVRGLLSSFPTSGGRSVLYLSPWPTYEIGKNSSILLTSNRRFLSTDFQFVWAQKCRKLSCLSQSCWKQTLNWGELGLRTRTLRKMWVNSGLMKGSPEPNSQATRSVAYGERHLFGLANGLSWAIPTFQIPI